MTESHWLVAVLTPGRSALLGAVVGLPSAVVAVAEGRPELVVAGAAIGIAAAVWSIWSTGANGQVRLLRRRLDEAQADVDKLHGEVDRLHGEVDASREARAALKIELVELKAKLVAAGSHRAGGG